MTRDRGYTLIEMSIVMVIIGLVVGAIVMGQSLLQAAQIRSQVSQVEQIETAVASFRSKYNCLAGDCAQATNFFSGVTKGNGNGVICRNSGGAAMDACLFATTNGAVAWSGTMESSSVFDHLAAAGLENMEQYDETVTASNMPGIGFPVMRFQGSGVQATAALGTRGGVLIHHLKTFQHIHEGPKITLGACGGGGAGTAVGFSCGMNGEEAYMLDAKMDDGLPLSGKVTIQGVGFVYRVPGAAFDDVGNRCTSSSSPSVNLYNIDANINSDNRRCALIVKMVF